jgi:hypothetical protein
MGVQVTLQFERTASSHEHEVRNQVLFREVNEHIAELTALAGEIDVKLFVCECGDSTCAESLELTASEYERVRSDGGRFVVVRGHEAPGREHVVDGTARFLVVETLGAAASIARESDPRDRG